MRHKAIGFAVVLAALVAFGQAGMAQPGAAYAYGKCHARDFWKPAVPDARTAIAIARSLTAAQGVRLPADDASFQVRLDRDVWRIALSKARAGGNEVRFQIDRCDGTVKAALPHPAG